MAVFAVAQGLSLFVVLATPNKRFNAVWSQQKYINAGTVALTGVLAGTVLLSIHLGSIRWKSAGAANFGSIPSVLTRQRYEPGITILYRAALLGHVAWLLIAINRGLSATSLAAAMFDGTAGASETNRRFFLPVPIISQLTQLSPLATAAIGVSFAARRAERQAVRLYKTPNFRRLILLIAIAALRSFARSERLALLEVCTTAFVAYFVTISYNSEIPPLRSGSRIKIRVLILLLPLLFVGVFSLFEASRSWTYHTDESRQTALSFGTERLIGYYATAANNSAMLVNETSAL